MKFWNLFLLCGVFLAPAVVVQGQDAAVAEEEAEVGEVDLAEAIVGHWAADIEGDRVELEFFADGSGKAREGDKGERFTWTLDTTRDPAWLDLVFKHDGVWKDLCLVALDEQGRLLMTAPSDERPATLEEGDAEAFTRVGGEGAGGAVEEEVEGEEVDAGEGAEVGAEAEAGLAAAILGRWEAHVDDEDIEIEFLADGSGKAKGEGEVFYLTWELDETRDPAWLDFALNVDGGVHKAFSLVALDEQGRLLMTEPSPEGRAATLDDAEPFTRVVEQE